MPISFEASGKTLALHGNLSLSLPLSLPLSLSLFLALFLSLSLSLSLSRSLSLFLSLSLSFRVHWFGLLHGLDLRFVYIVTTLRLSSECDYWMVTKMFASGAKKQERASAPNLPVTIVAHQPYCLASWSTLLSVLWIIMALKNRCIRCPKSPFSDPWLSKPF